MGTNAQLSSSSVNYLQQQPQSLDKFSLSGDDDESRLSTDSSLESDGDDINEHELYEFELELSSSPKFTSPLSTSWPRHKRRREINSESQSISLGQKITNIELINEID